MHPTGSINQSRQPVLATRTTGVRFSMAAFGTCLRNGLDGIDFAKPAIIAGDDEHVGRVTIFESKDRIKAGKVLS